MKYNHVFGSLCKYVHVQNITVNEVSGQGFKFDIVLVVILRA